MSTSNQHHFFQDNIGWQQSGLSQKAWCEQNNISYSSFHYGYRRFRKQHSDNKVDSKEGFVQLQVQDRLPGTPWCELVLANGQKLFFHQPVPAGFIMSLLD